MNVEDAEQSGVQWLVIGIFSGGIASESRVPTKDHPPAHPAFNFRPCRDAHCLTLINSVLVDDESWHHHCRW